MASATNFNHLPVAGGWYDQHPELVRQWLIIFEFKDREEKRQGALRKRQQAKKKVPGRGVSNLA